ncbi:MAG: glycosyltransferase family 4 protein [Candidatus Eisenbacteria bacterium]|nr:glycosyltransferase family 4 protein [Candidatus Eisenbacteria bacterium]
MRVLLVANVDLSRPGGLETHIRELARWLATRGHDVEILGEPADLPPFTMVRDPDPARYDVIHHHGGSWPARLPKDHRRVRTLHFCTAAKMALYVRMGRVKTLANLGNWRGVFDERARVRGPGRLIAVSDRVCAEFARHHGLDPGRARVISNGATFDPPREERATVRARLGVAPDAPVLLTIGRADFVKGYGLLGRAWRRARKPKGATWVIVGGGAPSRSRDRIVTGTLPHDQVIDWIHAADLGALPSYYEGCSVALLEMLAGGLYTLAHDVGNAAEVITPRVHGEIVPADEATWTALLTRALAALPPRPVRRLPETYRWDAIADRVAEVYREAIAEGDA